MKKLMLLVPVAALAMASCSSEDVVQQKATSTAQELTIRPVVQGATRSLISDANFDKFHVKAEITGGAFWRTDADAEAPTVQPTGEGTVLTTLSLDVLKNSGKWNLFGTPEQNYKWYWSSKNATGTFTGYNQDAGSFTVQDKQANQTDVLVAYNAGTASEFSNGVPMLFRHVLSQIVIKADNKDADVRQIKVGGVRLHNIYSEATLTHPTGIKTTADDFNWSETTYVPWSNQTAAKKFTYYKGTEPAENAVYSSETITLNATAQEISFGGALLMLPQEVAAATDLSSEASAAGKAYIDVLVQVQNLETTANTAQLKAIFPKIGNSEQLSNQTYAWVAVPVDIAWKPGYKYTYVLHFSKDGIGKASPDEEGGNPEPGPNPGTDIVDNPVPLYFTVTIDEWQDAANTEKNL